MVRMKKWWEKVFLVRIHSIRRKQANSFVKIQYLLKKAIGNSRWPFVYIKNYTSKIDRYSLL